jgi:3-phenylpropionate/trans-cinnamate dioxygenase ferredoxin reductase subunit
MLRGVGTQIGERLGALHRDYGVALRLGTAVAGLVADDSGQHVAGVRLSDGSTVASELVVIGIGSLPNTGWLAGSGLAIDDGVRADRYLQAAQGVFAIGDVVSHPHPITGTCIRAEHWTAATEHADAVAATITGEPTAVDDVGYVWSDQHGFKIQIVGSVQPGDEVRYLIDEPTRFLAVTGSAGRQHAAVGLRAAAAVMKQRAKLTAGAPWPPAED